MSNNKRPLPKDFDTPSLQTKVPRLDATPTPPVTTPATQGFIFPNRALSLPLHGITARPALPSQSSTALIGITGILPTVSPGGPKFEFRGAGQVSASSVLPIAAHALSGRLARISPSPQPTGNLSPFAAAAAAAIGLPGFQRVQTPPGGVAAFPAHFTPAAGPVIRAVSTPVQGVGPSLVLGSPVAARTAPPPPYPTPLSVGSTEQSSEDFTCSSPSQFLHSPTSLRPPVVTTAQAAISTSTTEASPSSVKENRQPICSTSAGGSTAKSRGGHSIKFKVLKHRKAKLAAQKLKYEVQLKEKFFLEGGGNMMDFVTWKRKPNITRDLYLKQYGLDSDGPSYSQLLSTAKDLPQARKSGTESLCRTDSMEVSSGTKLSTPSTSVTSKKSSPKVGSSKALKSQTSTSVASPTRIQIPLSTLTPSLQVSGTVTTPKASTTPSSPLTKSLSIATTPSPRPATRSHTSFTSMYETSHEDIVMRARQEAEVMRAIADLRKEGLWSASRLPKVHEPPRRKSHWDYLLEEMQWLATDFANERRWKINSSKKLCRSIIRVHQERELQHTRSEKEELLRLRKIASTLAKEVKHFWESIQKIVEHKHHVLLEEKRKKAMDMHLEFIVDQTAKYSNWLVKGLAGNKTPSEPSLQSIASHDDSDAFLTPGEESEDDEETIEKEEKQAEKDGSLDYPSELQQLQQEGELPLDQLLASLPTDILEGKPLSSEGEENEKMEAEQGEEEEAMEEGEKPSKKSPKRKSPGKQQPADESSESRSSRLRGETKRGKEEEADDEEYQEGEEEEENETTIEEQEDHEGEVDHREEIDALQKESDLSLEELLKLYNMQRQSATPETDIDEEEKMETDAKSLSSGDEAASESSEGEEEEEEKGGGEQLEGIELLVSGQSIQEACQTEEGLSNVAAAAEQFQPKGITLATTEVKTKVPFLLKHKLREYQHIGLEWLVAMDERRLNGILADEMGLGKTMQTIALLAHLACEKGNWGPHLIIVPTSVMLNWEFELKKWCPAFKILTYFGSLKERKQKRVGWSKHNAFHVCITSYNIAVQDHRAFKQKKWKYLILDEAQNIKNFKSQRWQILLNFNSQRRLLLTGTPLQNHLMELWSLMHFLMPTVFSSHSDFKEWFSNPLSGMVEGSQEYNESIVRRLHQVLRPFLLRRLKMEVEKQMPKKYEHLVLCRLSKRQRFLYDEYMSRAKTKDTLSGGNYLSVINILMQLRKVCNHPDLFEPRPITSPFRLSHQELWTASLALIPCEYDPFTHVNLDSLNLHLADYELDTEAFVAYRLWQLQAPRTLILDPSTFQPSLLSLEVEREEGKMSRFMEDLHMPQLTSQQEDWTFSCRRLMHEVNSRRCRRQPMYGTDLIRAVRTLCLHDTISHVSSPPPPRAGSGRKGAQADLPLAATSLCHWLWSGYVACYHHQVCDPHWSNSCQPLRDALPTYRERAAQLEDIINRFVIMVPRISAPPPSLHAYHPPPSTALREKVTRRHLCQELSPRADFFHPVATRNCFQFPETRLIQYDCGKLQTLDILLHRLKAGTHRVLIFTQMARMLDVLEIFLNYHGHTYLRLDGATPVQKRQFLMDRFNRDNRVFCFILSTRSGGLGINLTGADTVVFYDSDWNPTMDAQAQDRCHRIGQTRDVHIYRLVCERTVEENILKKANQKRLLGDIAIEGGGFTTEFFKEVGLRDLFKVRQEDEPLDSQRTSGVQTPITTTDATPTTENTRLSPKQLEELLLQAEDETDVQAARLAKAEQVAEMAEFDETFSAQTSATPKEGKPGGAEGSKVLKEFAHLEEQLNGVERYAMKFLEAENAEFAAQQLRIAEENIELAKKDWELSHLQSLREEEDRLAEEDVDDVMLTYDRPEATNKMYVDEATGEEMPIWFPPTPPADDSEVFYEDVVLDMSYVTRATMSTAVLTAIAPYSEDDYDVFGLAKRITSTVSEPSKRIQKSSTKQSKEHVNVPPSLFWRRVAADSLSTKLRKLGSHPKKLKSKDQFTPILEQGPEGPEWAHYEDWVLLKAMTSVLEYPLSLTISVPAQSPNWNIVADLTSTLSKVRRSPLQCREHVMNVVIPREDHTVKVEELESKKFKSRDSSAKKTKGRKEQRTKTLIVHDNGKEVTKQFSQIFEWISQASGKRVQDKSMSEKVQKPPSLHGESLKEYGVNLDTVHSPMQIAMQRAERIQSEIPRHSQVHQLLATTGPAQQYTHFSQIAARTYHSGAGFKPTAADLTKAGYTLPTVRQGAVASVAAAPQRFQPVVSNSTFSPQAKTPLVTTGVPTPLSSIPAATQIHTSTPTTHPTSLPTQVSKTFSVTSVSDISKSIPPALRFQQQFLLLRQSALQHQQQQQQAPQVPTPPPQLPGQQKIPPQPQTAQPPQTAQAPAAQKVVLPAGIEQLRPTVAVQPRFQTVTSATGAVRTIPATGRSLQTEEVLALLKQQSLRMASQSAYKAGPATQFHPREPPVTPLQFHPEGAVQISKQPSPGLPAPGGVKIVPSLGPAEGGQLKVVMVDQSKLQPKPQEQQVKQPQTQQQSQTDQSSDKGT